jgi:hypothetical protein
MAKQPDAHQIASQYVRAFLRTQQENWFKVLTPRRQLIAFLESPFLETRRRLSGSGPSGYRGLGVAALPPKHGTIILLPDRYR